MIASNPDQDAVRAAVQADRCRAGLRFGLIAGASFTLGAWGIDAAGLLQAHGLFPWLKLAMGLVVAIPVGALAGWLPVRLGKTLYAVLIWIVAGAILGWVSGRLPFGSLFPGLLTLFDSQLRGRISYPFYDAFSFRVGVEMLSVIGLSALAGLLELNLVDSAAFATAPLGRWLPLCLAIPFLLAGGVTADEMITAPQRTPLVTVNGLIDDALLVRANPGASVDIGSHLIELDPLQPFIDRPRHLIVGTYDNAYNDVNVLIDFNGAWGTCRVFYDQVVGCDRLGGP